MQNLSLTKPLVRFGLVLLFTLTILALDQRQPVMAACPELPSDKGVATTTIDVPANGTYRVWSRIMAPGASDNSYYLDIGDNSCGIQVGGSQITANTWAWVDYQNGNTGSKINVNLTAGTHTVKMAGKDANVKLDRIILVSNAGCTPTGMGDNCTPDITPPTVSMSSPANNATVYGVTSITVNASDNIGVTKVDFLINGTVAHTAQSSPYSFVWDTTTVSDGNKVLTARAYDAANNVTTSDPVSVTVDQSAAPPRATGGLTALYAFTEGSGNTVNDTSGSGSPLNLNIQDTNKIKWLEGANGVEITDSGSSIRSSGAATKIHSSLSSTGKASFEAWVSPSNLTQAGPARIMTASNGLFGPDVNFHIGQDNTSLTYRLRTSQSNTNYSFLPINETFTGTNTPMHVVATYDGTTQRVYINGQLQSDTVTPGGNFSNWNTSYPLILGNEINNDRSWLGKIYLAAVYNRNLSSSEVTQNYAAGPSVAGDNDHEPDTESPTVPSNLSADGVSDSQINLNWTASSDNVGVAGYEVYRNINLIATVIATSFGDSGLNASTTYTYYVRAFDGAGNFSANSGTAMATTQDTPITTGNISGTVSSSQGGGLSNATISVTVNGNTQTYTTNSSGNYLIANLPAGTYSLTFSHLQHDLQTVSVNVTDGSTTTRNLTLEYLQTGEAGDLNGDNKVNIFDLSIMLSNWGSNNQVADLNNDGTVNIFDLSILLSNWTG